MSRVTHQLPLLLLIAVVFLPPTAACDCDASTFRSRYAAATTVVKARVISVTVSPTPTPLPCLSARPPCLPPIFLPQSIKYRFQLRAVFKGCAPDQVFFGRSFEDEALCGILLEEGKVYLLNLGRETPDLGGQPDSFSIGLCQGNLLFNTLSRGQKRFLRRSSRKPENQCLTD